MTAQDTSPLPDPARGPGTPLVHRRRPGEHTPPTEPTSGGSLTGAIRRHPLGAFFLWFFTVGQAFAFTPVVAREVYDVDLTAQPFIVASTLVGLLLPALVITRITDGPAGLRTFRRSMFKARVPLRWYAVAVVVVPLVTLALALAFLGMPDADAATIAGAVASGLLLQGFLVFASNNLWEEAAWTGFVQVRLQQRHGALRAAALTAPLFALQHVSLVFGNELVFGVVFMLAFAVIAIPFRALVGWAYNVTGSLFLVGLIHAAGNAMTGGSGFFGDGFLGLLYSQDVVGVLHQLANVLIGLVVIVATRRRLGLRDGGAPGTHGGSGPTARHGAPADAAASSTSTR